MVEIGIGEDGKLLLDGLKESDSNVETIVSAMCQLCRVPHGTKGPTGFCLNIEGSS